MCRRPASKAGKLIHVAPNMAICQDCMQKTFDTMGQMPGIPGLGDINIGDMLSSGKMPNIQFVNMSDLPFGNQQKVKKEKTKREKERRSRFWISARFRHRIRSKQVWMTM